MGGRFLTLTLGRDGFALLGGGRFLGGRCITGFMFLLFCMGLTVDGILLHLI